MWTGPTMTMKAGTIASVAYEPFGRGLHDHPDALETLIRRCQTLDASISSQLLFGEQSPLAKSLDWP